MLSDKVLYGLLALVGQAAAGAARKPSPPSTSTSTPNVCYVTHFSGIPAAVAACTCITLDGITVPGKSTIDLSELKTGSKVVFKGNTFWEYADANYPLMKVSGHDIEITADSAAVLDGNGPAWWDGQGSNGGRTKPDHFIEVTQVTGSSSVHDLYIQNYPVHCFSISNSANVDIHHITLNNTLGNMPSKASNGRPAAHNSDGFDIWNCNNTTVRDSKVFNQDDCVAVTSGNRIMVNNMYCKGGHGLSIGSVGGKSNNFLTNVVFQNSIVQNAENGIRIKSNSKTTGFVANILYQNITLENISTYGIDIQQDYLNGGPTGKPTNGVKMQNITMRYIKGTATHEARHYYILCGKGSCEEIKMENVQITGAGVKSSCNVRTQGDFDCDDGFTV